jgi:hypothetical protein
MAGQVTTITVTKKGSGARVTVSVEGDRPDFAKVEVMDIEGRSQIILLLGPTEYRELGDRVVVETTVEEQPIVDIVSTIQSRFDPARREEWGTAVNIMTTKPIGADVVTMTQDNSSARRSLFYVDIAA